jgi:hypothetical protein
VQIFVALFKRISSSHLKTMHPSLKLIPSLFYHPVVWAALSTKRFGIG